MDCLGLPGEKPIIPAPPKVWPDELPLELELDEPVPLLLPDPLDEVDPLELSVEEPVVPFAPLDPDELPLSEEPKPEPKEEPKLEPEEPKLEPEEPKLEPVLLPAAPFNPLPPLGPIPASVLALPERG